MRQLGRVIFDGGAFVGDVQVVDGYPLGARRCVVEQEVVDPEVAVAHRHGRLGDPDPALLSGLSGPRSPHRT